MSGVRSPHRPPFVSSLRAARGSRPPSGLPHLRSERCLDPCAGGRVHASATSNNEDTGRKLPCRAPRAAQFLAHSASAVALAAAGSTAMAAMGPNDKFDLVVKGGEVLDPEPEPQGQARHRHPLRRDRGARGRHPGRQGAEGAERRRQARHARPDRPARPRLPVRLGHRHSRRRARALPGHDHAGLRRRCRRQQHRRLPPRHRRPDPRQALRLRAHRQHRPAPASRCPSSTTSTSRRRRPPPRRWRRTPTSCSASRCA